MDLNNPVVSIDEFSLRDHSPGSGEFELSNSEREELRAKLEQLRDDYRTVLELRFLAGLSPDETAEVMGRSSGAIRVLQHRALAALRMVLEGSH